MQFSLFPPDPDRATACEHPDLAPLSGYTYGCRCPRCTDAKATWTPERTCQHDGCEATKVKHRRWCADHLPPPRRPSSVRTDATCTECDRSFWFYESQIERHRPEVRDFYRQVCPACRAEYVGAIKAHGLNAAQALRLVRLTHCEMNGEPLALTRTGRRDVVVDHDHRCCPGETGCARCVRGFICRACNADLGAYERLCRRPGGVAAAEAWVRAA